MVATPERATTIAAATQPLLIIPKRAEARARRRRGQRVVVLLGSPPGGDHDLQVRRGDEITHGGDASSTTQIMAMVTMIFQSAFRRKLPAAAVDWNITFMVEFAAVMVSSARPMVAVVEFPCSCPYYCMLLGLRVGGWAWWISAIVNWLIPRL